MAAYSTDASLAAAVLAGLLPNLRYLAICATLPPPLAGEPRALRPRRRRGTGVVPAAWLGPG